MESLQPPQQLLALRGWGPAEKNVWDLMNGTHRETEKKRHHSKSCSYYYYIISAIVLQAPLGVENAVVIRKSSFSVPSIRLPPCAWHQQLSRW